MVKSRFSKVMALLVLSVIVLSSNAYASQSTNSIKVTGHAVVTAAPDVAYITLGVETKSNSAASSSEENAAAVANVIAKLKEFGLTDSEITTSNYNIYSYQDYDRITDPQTYVTVYYVRNQLNIKTNRLSEVGKIIDLAIRAGANQVQGIKFDLEDKSELQLLALKNATKQAAAKAKAIAEAANVEIASLINVTEEYEYYAPYTEVNMFRSAAAGIADTQINPSDVEVTARIVAEYGF